MPRRLLMAEQWDQFSRALGLENTSPTQQREMKRAFYGGAESIMFRVVIPTLSPGRDVTEADLQVMRDLDSELREFSEAVKKGLA
jgi:hypothetical protein